MLRVAPDSSTIERTLEELYPGGIFVIEWEKCLYCGRDVDVYIYETGERKGYCFDHADSKPDFMRSVINAK